MKLRKIFYTAISSTLLAALSTCIYPEVSKVEIYAAEYSDNWKLNSDNNPRFFPDIYYLYGSHYHYKLEKFSTEFLHLHTPFLYESYGKYYLLDDVRGTGTYGKLLIKEWRNI